MDELTTVLALRAGLRDMMDSEQNLGNTPKDSTSMFGCIMDQVLEHLGRCRSAAPAPALTMSVGCHSGHNVSM